MRAVTTAEFGACAASTRQRQDRDRYECALMRWRGDRAVLSQAVPPNIGSGNPKSVSWASQVLSLQRLPKWHRAKLAA